MTSKRVSKRPADLKQSTNSKQRRIQRVRAPRRARRREWPSRWPEYRGELVILTGLSGSGKLSALKAFEDLGYYSVDNLPLELGNRDLRTSCDSLRRSNSAALVVDVREGMRLDEFPSVLKEVRKVLPTHVVFLGGE